MMPSAEWWYGGGLFVVVGVEVGFEGVEHTPDGLFHLQQPRTMAPVLLPKQGLGRHRLVPSCGLLLPEVPIITIVPECSPCRSHG